MKYPAKTGEIILFEVMVKVLQKTMYERIIPP